MSKLKNIFLLSFVMICISFIQIQPVKGKEAKRCVYKHQNAIITATEESTAGKYTIDATGTDQLWDGYQYISTYNKIKENAFADGTDCPAIYACKTTDNSQCDAFGVCPSIWFFYTKGAMKCSNSVEVKGTVENVKRCVYEHQFSDQKCVVTVSPGVNKIQTKTSCNNIDIKLDNSLYYQNGEFVTGECPKVSWHESTSFEGVNYHEIANDASQLSQTDGGTKVDDEGVKEEPSLPGTTKPTPEVNEVTGCAILGEHVTPIVKWAIRLAQIASVLLIVILTITDFLGIVLSGEEKNFKEAGARFIKRLLAGVAIIFAPAILAFLIDLSGLLGQYGISNDDLFCSLF